MRRHLAKMLKQSENSVSQELDEEKPSESSGVELETEELAAVEEADGDEIDK